MKKLIFLTLMTMLALLCACSDEPVVPEQRDGEVFMADGKYYKATTSFTDEQAMTILQSHIWFEYESFFYDKNMIATIPEIPLKDRFKTVGGPLCYYYYFLNDSIFRYCSTGPGWRVDETSFYPADDPDYRDYYTYSIKDKILDVRYNRFNRSQTHMHVKIVSVDDDMVVIDRYVYDWSDNSLPYGIDKPSAVRRSIWVKNEP